MNQDYAYHQSAAQTDVARMPEIPSGVQRLRQEAELNRKLIDELSQRLCSIVRPCPAIAQADGLKIAHQTAQSDVGRSLDEIGNMISGGNEQLRDLMHRLEL